jgi:hypothetical protein
MTRREKILLDNTTVEHLADAILAMQSYLNNGFHSLLEA